MLRFDGAVIANGDFELSADMTVQPGSVVAIIGPSGSGKSTLLGGLAGFHSLTAGRITWQGNVISNTAPAQRPVSMLFQDNNLFPHLSVMQNVALACAPRLRPSAEVRKKVGEMLRDVGLEGLSERKPAALSGGQQSRAALARALLQDRDIMLMDEPFSALGPALKAQMLDLSVKMAQSAGRTVIMVTHDPEDAARVADTIVGVAEGRALAPVETDAFLSAPPPPFDAYLA